MSALLQPPGADIPRYVVLTLAAWLCWVVALRVTLTLPRRHPRVDLAFIFGVALLMRLTLLFTQPSLSDDVYRSVWDARLVHLGVNPYSYAPGAPETEPYRDAVIWPRINHKEQRTPYPPLAEILGAAAYAALPEQPLAMQGLAAGMDLVAAGLVAWLLAKIGSDPRRCIVIAWSPIGALHFAHSGHNDAAMVAALAGAALLVAYNRHWAAFAAPGGGEAPLPLGRPAYNGRWLAFAALGAATAIKAVPALMLPAFLAVRARGAPPRSGLWLKIATVFQGTAIWMVAIIATALPFSSAGPNILAGVVSEAGSQRFNDSFYLVAERIAGLMALPLAETAPRVLALAALVVAAAWSWIGGKGEGAARYALVAGSRVVAVYLLVAPVVGPWYVTWLAPLITLELQPGKGRWPFAFNDAPAWLWLSGAAILTELTYLAGGSSWWPAIRLVEYGPTYLLLGIALVAHGRRQPK